MIALIPMAGEGSRYQKAGYATPKPLIPVLGKPMVVRAAEALPQADRYIFICRDFHLSEYHIDEQIKVYYPEAEFIVIDRLTEGQASTCLLAKDWIDTEEELVIGASDNGMIFDRSAFDEERKKADCLVFSFRDNVTVVHKPEQYGWIKVDDFEYVNGMSVKVPISDKPMYDHAVIGAFWFKSGRLFVEAAERMIGQDRRINGEFYVDECVNDVLALRKTAKVFETDYYIGWGTPDDLHTFEYWRDFFGKAPFNPYRERHPEEEAEEEL